MQKGVSSCTRIPMLQPFKDRMPIFGRFPGYPQRIRLLPGFRIRINPHPEEWIVQSIAFDRTVSLSLAEDFSQSSSSSSSDAANSVHLDVSSSSSSSSSSVYDHKPSSSACALIQNYSIVFPSGIHPGTCPIPLWEKIEILGNAFCFSKGWYGKKGRRNVPLSCGDWVRTTVAKQIVEGQIVLLTSGMSACIRDRYGTIWKVQTGIKRIQVLDPGELRRKEKERLEEETAYDFPTQSSSRKRKREDSSNEEDGLREEDQEAEASTRTESAGLEKEEEEEGLRLLKNKKCPVVLFPYDHQS